jgi:hemoglobin-like flavoprotein
MTKRQIKLLRESFARVEPQGSIAALVFYRHLFTLDPSLRALFKTDIEIQSRKLIEALAFTVASLENPKALVPVLEDMGRRHFGCGVRDEHYDTVNTALLQSLQEILGKALTGEVRRAWKTALLFVSETMKRGAAQVSKLQNERPTGK